MCAGPAPSWASEHSKSLFSCTVQVSGLEALALRHRSYCSICGLQRSLTALTGELRAHAARQTGGRLGAGRRLRRALLRGAGTQRLLQLVARGVPAARVGVYTVDVCTELGGAVPLDCCERGLHFLTGSSLCAHSGWSPRVVSCQHSAKWGEKIKEVLVKKNEYLIESPSSSAHTHTNIPAAHL